VKEPGLDNRHRDENPPEAGGEDADSGVTTRRSAGWISNWETVPLRSRTQGNVWLWAMSGMELGM
jgi:hypothetical protein